MKVIGGLIIIAIFVLVSGIIFLLVSMNQVINERNYCRHTPMNQMSGNDYRYCLQYLGEQK